MPSKVAIFPHLLVRVAGGPLCELSGLSPELLSPLLEEAARADEDWSGAADAACDILHAAVPRHEKPARKQLINAKRDIYNRRAVRWSGDGADDAVRDALRRYAEAGAALDASLERAMAAYESSALEARRNLRRLAGGSELLEGLCLSSLALYDRQASFVRSAPEATDRRTREAETGFLKYVSRMLAKTSPLSTFGHVGAARLDAASAMAIAGSGRTLRSARVNAYVCRVLLDTIYRTPDLRAGLTVRLNETLTRAGDIYRCLANVDNIESFQEVAATEVVETIVSLPPLAAGMRWPALVERLCSEFEAERGDVEPIVEKLFSAGFLEGDLRTGGDDSGDGWEAELTRFLRACPPSAARETLLKLMRQLMTAASLLPRAAASRRRMLLPGAYRNFLSARKEVLAGSPEPADAAPLWSIDENAQQHGEFRRALIAFTSITPERMMFEDSILADATSLPTEAVAAVVPDLDALYRRCYGIDRREQRRQQLNDFFRATYRGATVPLLDLYRDYARSIAARGLASDEGLVEPMLRERSQPVAERLHHLYRAGDDEVRLAPEDFGEPDLATRNSHGAVLQLYWPSGREQAPVGILNHPTVGYSKMLSRFLDILDPAVLDAARSWNDPSDALWAEAADASFHTANIHPAFLPYTITTPGSHPFSLAGKPIPVAQLVVHETAENWGLELLDRLSGQRVEVFDVGFQTDAGRSTLYILLSYFSSMRIPFFAFWIRAIEHVVHEAGGAGHRHGIVKLPRVYLGDRVMLLRRSWEVPPPQLPRREQQSEFEYFRQLDRWRRGLGLPRTVFVHVRGRSRQPGTPGPAPPSTVRRDDKKPQYIDFESPLFGNLFAGLVERCETRLDITEMLPGPESAGTFGDEQRVTEFLVQWYSGPDR